MDRHGADKAPRSHPEYRVSKLAAKPPGSARSVPVHPDAGTVASPPVNPPPCIDYGAQELVGTIGQEITPIVPISLTGDVTDIIVTPVLPDGLTITNTGVISGTATEIIERDAYRILPRDASEAGKQGILYITINGDPDSASSFIFPGQVTLEGLGDDYDYPSADDLELFAEGDPYTAATPQSLDYTAVNDGYGSSDCLLSTTAPWISLEWGYDEVVYTPTFKDIDYTPPEVATSSQNHRLSIFLPDEGRFPPPEEGYKWLFYIPGGLFQKQLPLTQVSRTADPLLHGCLRNGIAVVTVGITGINSDDTKGIFYPQGSAEWDDFTIAWPEKDAVWAKLHLEYFKDDYLLAPGATGAIGMGTSAGGIEIAHMALGKERGGGTWSALSPQLQETTQFAGIIPAECIVWWLAYRQAETLGLHFEDQLNPGEQAPTLSDASAADQEAGSVITWIHEVGSYSAVTPVYLAYDEPVTSTNYARTGTRPDLFDDIFGVHVYWNGIMMWKALLDVDAAFHNANSLLTVQRGLEQAAPENYETANFPASEKAQSEIVWEDMLQFVLRSFGLGVQRRSIDIRSEAFFRASLNIKGANLPAGTYTGTITAQNETTGRGTITWNATLELDAPATGAFMSVTPQEPFQTFGEQGGPFEPPDKTYTVTNTGDASMNWTATFLSGIATTATPSAGTLAPGASVDVLIDLIDAVVNSFGVGFYGEFLYFTNTTNNAGDTVRNLGIQVDPPTSKTLIQVDPDGDASASGPVGGPFILSENTFDVSQILTLAPGDTDVDVLVTPSDPVNFSGSPLSFTIGRNDTIQVELFLTAAASSLPDGTYSCTYTFQNLTDPVGGGDTTRDMTLTVGTGAGAGNMVVTPVGSQFSFTSQEGTGVSSPSSYAYVVLNDGGSPIDVSLTFTQPGTAFRMNGASSLSFTLGSNAQQSVVVTLDPTDLASLSKDGSNIGIPGTYGEILNFTNTTNGNGDTTRNGGVTILDGSSFGNMIVHADPNNPEQGYVQDGDNLLANLYGGPSNYLPYPLAWAIEHTGARGNVNGGGFDGYGTEIIVRSGIHRFRGGDVQATPDSGFARWIESKAGAVVEIRGDGSNNTFIIPEDNVNLDGTDMMLFRARGDIGHPWNWIRMTAMQMWPQRRGSALRVGLVQDVSAGAVFDGWDLDDLIIDGQYYAETDKGYGGVPGTVRDRSANGIALDGCRSFRLTNFTIGRCAIGYGLGIEHPHGTNVIESGLIYQCGLQGYRIGSVETFGGFSGLPVGDGTVTVTDVECSDNTISPEAAIPYLGGQEVFVSGRYAGSVSIVRPTSQTGFDKYTVGLSSAIRSLSGGFFGTQFLVASSDSASYNRERTQALTVSDGTITYAVNAGIGTLMRFKGVSQLEVKDNAITSGSGFDAISVNNTYLPDQGEPTVVQYCISGNTGGAVQVFDRVVAQPHSFAWTDCGGPGSGPDAPPTAPGSDFGYTNGPVYNVDQNDAFSETPTGTPGSPDDFFEVVGSQDLDPGLSIDFNTGAITGSIQASLGTYTVVARRFNSVGSETVNLTFVIGGNNPLSLGVNTDKWEDFGTSLHGADAMSGSSQWLVVDSTGQTLSANSVVPYLPSGVEKGYPDWAQMAIDYPGFLGVTARLHQSIGANYRTGTYTLFFEGDPLSCDAILQDPGSGVTLTSTTTDPTGTYKTYTVAIFGASSLNMRILSSNNDAVTGPLTGPIRNIRVWVPGETVGQTDGLAADYLGIITELGNTSSVLRLLNWCQVNFCGAEVENPGGPPYTYSPSTRGWTPDWANRKPFPYVRQSQSDDRQFDPVAPELWCELARRTGRPIWITLPHRYTLNDAQYTAYVTSLAQFLKDNYPAGLDIYVEYSNEIWNGQYNGNASTTPRASGFPVAAWMSELAFTSGLSYEVTTAREILKAFEAWEAVWSGADRTRTKFAVMGHVINVSFAAGILAEIQAQGRMDLVDGVGCAGYFRCTTAQYQDYNTRLSDGDGTNDPTVAEIITDARASIPATLSPGFVAHRSLADTYGIALWGYEGGDGIESNGPVGPLLNQCHSANPEMYDAYEQWMQALVDDGFDLFVHFSLCRPVNTTLYNQWGLRRNQRQVLGSGASPRLDRWAQGPPAP